MLSDPFRVGDSFAAFPQGAARKTSLYPGLLSLSLSETGNEIKQTELVPTYLDFGRTKEFKKTVANGDKTYYAWGGSSVVAEYSETGSQTTMNWSKSYIFAGSRLLSTITKSGSSELTEYHHPDRLGTKLVTDTVANTAKSQSTLPFGALISAETQATTNQKFTSYDRSGATGLDYAVNRTYNSGQSRFTQVDPIEMGDSDLGNPQSQNLFAYTRNNPIDFNDPSGLKLSFGCSAEFSFSDCGGDKGFWGGILTQDGGGGGGGGGASFGDEVGSRKRDLGDLPAHLQNQVNDHLNRIEDALAGIVAGVIAVVFVDDYRFISTDFRNLDISGALRGGRPAVCIQSPAGGCFGNQAIRDTSLELLSELSLVGGIIRGALLKSVTAVVSRVSTLKIAQAGARSLANKVPRTPSVLGHIFKKAIGHVNPMTVTSRSRFLKLFEKVANNPNNLNSNVLTNFQRNTGGFQGFARTFRNGRQVWVQVRNGKIFNAGVNKIPK